LSNALGRLSLPKPPRGAGAACRQNPAYTTWDQREHSKLQQEAKQHITNLAEDQQYSLK